MKFWGLVSIIVVGVFAFVVGQRLSADAVGMAVGVLFGVLAGVPAALLVLASSRKRQDEDYEDEDQDADVYSGRGGRRQSGYPPQQVYGGLPAQAPVIVFAPPSSPAPASAHSYGYPNQYVNGHAGPPALPGPTAPQMEGRRAFKVVGEQEEWISEW